MTQEKELISKGFIKVAEFRISDLNYKSLKESNMIVENITIKIIDNFLYNQLTDINYSFVSTSGNVIYVGESKNSMNDRNSGYYHKVCNWKRSPDENNKTWSKEFVKSPIVSIYIKQYDKITGPFGNKVSCRKYIEEDMIVRFNPVCNQRKDKKN